MLQHREDGEAETANKPIGERETAMDQPPPQERLRSFQPPRHRAGWITELARGFFVRPALEVAEHDRRAVFLRQEEQFVVE